MSAAHLIALVMAGIVATRCVCVLNILQHQPGRAYHLFIGFGVSYVTLAVTALGAALHILEGTQRGPVKREPSMPAGVPPMPERLKVDAVAVEQWQELAVILTKMGVLTTGDGEALATLCEVHSAEQSCLLQLRAGGAVMHTDLGGVKPNPAGPMYRSLVAMKASLLSEFGLTPSSRTKLATQVEVKKDELEEFFTAHG